jgi:hypothetical protein
MKRGRIPALQSRAGWCAMQRSQSAAIRLEEEKKLGGSTPVASSPHRGARFASMRLLGIGQQTLPGSIRPSGRGIPGDRHMISCVK